MGISRDTLHAVLKTANTFDIFVVNIEIKSSSVIATVQFNKNQVKAIEFHVWQGFTLRGDYGYLNSWCKEVWSDYLKIKACKKAMLGDKLMLDLIDSNFFTFYSFLASKGIESPITKDQIKQFIDNNSELCKEFKELLDSYELVA